MDKFQSKTVAVIDVGSNALRMVIGEITYDGEVRILEDVKKSTLIGKDTFAKGKISFSTIHETCEILNNFVRLMNEYKVEYYEAVSTSGVREANNRNYILEQIRVVTGLEVKIINNAEERFFTYKAIREHISNSEKIRQEGVVILDIGSGGVEISVYYHGSLKFMNYIKVGPLRLWETIGKLEQKTLDFPQIMEEYIESRLYLIKKKLQGFEIKNFIGLGGELRNIYRICHQKKPVGMDKSIDSSMLKELYKIILNLSVEQVIDRYELEYAQARNLIPSVILINSFLKVIPTDKIITPLVSLRHGILADIVDRWFNTPRKIDFINDIVSSVRFMGQKYGIDETHSVTVEKLALEIFDGTMSIHGLRERERLYLQLAAIIHDIGKFIDLNYHALYSGEIVRSQSIMGLSDRELNIIANIVRYHDDDEPRYYHQYYNLLNFQDQIMVSKLTAILKLANALDISHKSKINDLTIKEKGKKLYFYVTTQDDFLLEKWFFDERSTFFEEVLGRRPILQNKGWFR